MDERQIGIVKEIFCYPVKSMQGQRLNEAHVDRMGISGDRAYALREDSGRFVSAKNRPQILDFFAHYDGVPSQANHPPLKITLPDGRTINAQAPDASAALSEALGRTIELEGRLADLEKRAEFKLDGATIFGDVPVEQVVEGSTAATMPTAWAMLPGSFFDEFIVTLLATGTLRHMHRLTGEDARLDARRFRPNILVETEPGKEGFLEDDWLDGIIEIGASVRLAQIKSNIRCVMTTLPQADLPRDMRIIRTAVKHHRNYIGVGAVVEAIGTVRIGDPVILHT